METAIEKKSKFVLRIETDLTPESPRNWDNLGTMVCWHGRYTLGDEQPSVHATEWKINLASQFDSSLGKLVEYYEQAGWAKLSGSFDEKCQQVNAILGARVRKALDANVVMLPLYLYDHSGITMSTSSFSCPWDSGQVGQIYVTKAEALKEYGWTKLTAKRRALIETYLKGEVETYDQYLTGEVYGYAIDEVDLDSDGHLDVDVIESAVESCWGFYGRESATEEGSAVLNRLEAEANAPTKATLGHPANSMPWSPV